ncbi:MAG: dihydroorotase [Eubacteriales bacterium]|nr:dihydroorotase [Eubacteriales bacterium]
MKVLIKGGRVINPANDFDGIIDILFEKDKILNISKNIDETEAQKVIDATNLIVSPGFVDLHANFMDPGLVGREDLKSGCLSSAKGGYTSIVLGTENKPSPDQVNVIEYIKKYSQIMPIRIYPVGAFSEERLGEYLADLRFLYNHGAIGFSDGLRPIDDKELLKQGLLIAKKLQVPVAIYLEDLDKVKVRGINEGKVSEKLKVGATNSIAEDLDCAKIFELAKETNARIDIAYLSTKRSVEIINIARLMNLDIHAEVQALSLILTEKALEKKGTLAKVLPPLRTEQDRKALIEGLQSNTIEIISSNHFPCTEEEKSLRLREAQSGAIGLETVLGICGLKLVDPGLLSWNEVISKISLNPANLYSLDAGELKIGGRADITIFDPEEQWVVEDKFESKSKNTPLIGTTLKGKIKYTICKGLCVYRDKTE